jgi:hypothetical protein
MHKETIRILKVSVLTGLLAAVSAQAELVRNPTQLGTNIDVGQIVKGRIWKEAEDKGEADRQVITRTGVFLTESGVINERLTIQLTIGGLFWFALPEESAPETRRVLFGPGVGQAQGIYAFGADPEKPAATLRFGLFPHKYSESVNLGEYLYRSGTYPGYLITGGWSYVNSSSYLAQGVHLSVPMLNGMLTHDVTLFMERDIEPTHDISPGYMLTYKPVPGVKVGAGAVWAHGIPLKSDKYLTPKRLANAYSKSTGRPANNDTAVVNPCRDGVASDCGYYTYRGFKLAGHASVDVGSLVEIPGIRPNDFKLYGEVALLGVEDHPYVYDDKTERMPITLGLNLPTFTLLDQLSFETEYRKSRFPNNIGSTSADQNPLPVGTGESVYAYTDPKTSWKWTAYARRQVVNGVTLHAQAANDHLRHFATIFALPAHRPSTERNSDWYYVVRQEFGI